MNTWSTLSQILNTVATVLLVTIGVLGFYKVAYLVLGFVCKPRRYLPTEKRFNYAFAIAARNEENVIGQLIESIHKQTYDASKITIFIVADNCDACDKTAQIARDAGCIVYERTDPHKARKGFAMEFLFENIQRDYGITSFDGYFIFDADNLLDIHFVEEMNNAFAAGESCVTSYRNTKNFEANWVSSAYGIHFYRNSVTLHRPRSMLRLGTHLTGTGYLIASQHIADGWHYYSLTEDDELSMRLTGKGTRIGYCETAEFFDEQPLSFMVGYRQRMRWAKGRLHNFFHHAGRPLLGIFKPNLHRCHGVFIRRFDNRFVNWLANRCYPVVSGCFTCFDIFAHYFPYALCNVYLSVLYPVCGLIIGLNNPEHYSVWDDTLKLWLITQAGNWLEATATALAVMIREHKRIYTSKVKAFLYTALYPWFNLISPYITLSALLSRVVWTPIVHTDSRRIEDIKPRKKTGV